MICQLFKFDATSGTSLSRHDQTWNMKQKKSNMKFYEIKRMEYITSRLRYDICLHKSLTYVNLLTILDGIFQNMMHVNNDQKYIRYLMNSTKKERNG